VAKRTSARIGALAAMVLASPWSARAADLCDGLKAVIADAPQNFATIRGKPDRATGYFTHPVLLPGAAPPPGLVVSCLVAEFPPKTKRYGYSCTFPGPSGDVASAKTAFSSFIQDIERCLALPHGEFDLSSPGDQGRMGAANRGPVELSTEKAVVTLGLGYPPHGGPGFFGISVKPR